jgi:hypothetical protein
MKTSKSIQIIVSLGLIAILYFPGLGCFPRTPSPPEHKPIEQPPVKLETINYPDGSRYEGAVLDGKPHGRGMMTYPDGRRYNGQFHHGKLHGYGVMIYPDGRAEKGEWRDGQRLR